jgi:hypothetical protein
MRERDQSLGEVTTLLEAGEDVDALSTIRRLADQTDDPALQRELNEILATGRASSRGLRRSWDRLLLAYVVGR